VARVAPRGVRGSVTAAPLSLGSAARREVHGLGSGTSAHGLGRRDAIEALCGRRDLRTL